MIPSTNRRIRRSIAALPLAAALAVGGVTAAGASPAPEAPAARGTTLSAAEAGTVTVRLVNGRLRVTAVSPRAGWKVVENRATGRKEVDVTFRNGRRVVEFDAEVRGRSIASDVSRRQAPRARNVDIDATTFQAGPAGTVTARLVDGRVELVEVVPNAGWTVVEDRERGPFEIDVTFRSADQEVELEIDVSNGRLTSDLEIESLRGAAPSADGEHTISAGAAGSIVVSKAGSTLTLVSTAPADGWTARVDTDDDDADEVEVDFRSATEVVELSVDIERGVIETEIEQRSAGSVSDDDSDDDDSDDDDSNDNDDDSNDNDNDDD